MLEKLDFVKRRWFQFFAGGTVLFFASEQILKFTGNPHMIPTVILLGAFIVPVSFVAYFYGQERFLDRGQHGQSPFTAAALCVLLGGLLGILVSGVLEYGTLTSLAIWGLFIVGLIEESAKLIFPLFLYFQGRYRSEADGLLFGVASGMGFAAFETMGYGLVALIQSGGSIGALEETLLVRGLLSPVGHAAWTGIICAALWLERKQSGKLFNPAALGFYVVAISLHSLWDIMGSIDSVILSFAGFIIIGGISISLLIRRLVTARRTQPLPEPVEEIT